MAALDFVARGLSLRLLLLDARFELLDLGPQLPHVVGVAIQVERRETANTGYPRGSALHPLGARNRIKSTHHTLEIDCWRAVKQRIVLCRKDGESGQLLATVSGCRTTKGDTLLWGRRWRT